MKTTRLLQLRTLAAVALTASLSLTSLSKAALSIVGSKHDLSKYVNSGGNGTTQGTGQVCVACHTPHNAQATQLVPLWNHAPTTATFTLYTNSGTNSSLNATTVTPTGSSKACLSCHDGTIALDSFGGKTPQAGVGVLTGSANLSNDLSNDHPVSFTYDSALATADGGLVAPATTSLVGTLPLFSAKLECATCHNPHDNTLAPFLRKTTTGSALCLNCHSK